MFIFRRQNLLALKEKSQKSRSSSVNNSPVSINNNVKNVANNNSDEENEDESFVKEAKSSTNLRSSMERLDTQVLTLHQDVATLGIEVRNAIQALQEMASYTTLSHMDNHIPARSIPNLQNVISSSHVAPEYLTRSSSQPAVWHRSHHHIKSISGDLCR